MAGDTVGLTDIAARLPALVLDAPVVARGTLTAFIVRGSAKKSIGRVFQDRAARYPDHVFIRFDDEGLTYREANETVNRYAATLAERGVGRGDVVGVIMRNSARTLLVMLAAVKLGAIAGMLNQKQRGNVLAHSVGLLHAQVIVGEEDLLSAVDESEAEVADTVTIDELDRLSADAPTDNPAVTSSVLAKDPAFYIFTSGTTGAPKASVMTHYRWLRAMGGSGAIGMRLKSSDTVYCCLPLYHNTALSVAVSGVISAGATLALGRSFSASRFWDDVTRYDATAFVYIGEVCRYLLNQPERDTDRTNKVRVIGGNGLRPDIWDEFTARFNIPQVFELYGASEGNTGFVNIFHIPKTAGLCPTAVAFVEYDPETGEPVRDENGRVRKVRRGQPGLLLSKITKAQPFDGYTDPEASEKKLIRNAFRDGDVWLNSGDLLRPQGWRHAVFVDRLGDTFRWKGENVATTDVEAAVAADPGVEAVTVFGVKVPGADGRAGMAAAVLKDGTEFDAVSLAHTVYDRLPGYAVPLFIRVVDSLEHTATVKTKKVDLREQGYGPDVDDPVYVLNGREEGYVPYYDDYPDEVAAGERPAS
ncbi:MAG TPA: long-chain-acyl-CoA synthetase FadD6 [Mycobacterium sp.]|uniref:long-chain-acyl-CoA synthetase FadD6 n=1 Tax=Mycobacterium sp. TaxID=1785 RepID=UPI002CB6518E|nr:long-chain-acyl-CoA synthetase FadD6 [Mycobacterium sp.]HME75695.1 long-chain-acyl-CoA synthetase FadD6 [Mycobacterium sp.]